VSAFNVVRFRVKHGHDEPFLAAHQHIGREWPGLKQASIIKTGDDTYCLIAEWNDVEALRAARPNMISTLNGFRDTLEDLGSGLGVTDAVAGPVVMHQSG
jgi:hypothetical protein